MDILDSMVKFFQEGGTFMYPVLFAFAIGGAIALERYIKLTYVRHVNRRVWDKVQPMLASGGFEEARGMIDDDSTEISSVLRIGLENQGMHRRREDIELAMEDNLRDIVPHLEKRTPYVALFSNISTRPDWLGSASPFFSMCWLRSAYPTLPASMSAPSPESQLA